ncbi:MULTISPECIES: ROK family transcriptional regulator [Paenibacillus]|uniref:Sugar kinase n=1 Tax=Paenibacillus odorifer TaxID=189426 RepID=A0A1R0XAD2_9BACL|nr:MULTISPECIES: ROK family transcriptional regulator [Paenibacillus]AIQ75342.1 ROK family transcriptional regulator [Paenibacillus odorifer]ETT46201.1 ROK family protein [Paenibacillus sp. FSL H8-237]MEC0224046.1 ROK family transcriptional regulator [Paenibacillus odorifer]OMC97912.1 sugar kinase [Paenibacillus odorifer]OMD02886.1 sugar kinase [Paenibacillus odorifer]
MKKHDQDFMKRQNRLTVFEIIKNQQPISRASIAKQTGMSPTTVSRIVGELTEEGYLLDSEQVSSGLGRKSTLIGMIDTSVLSVGVELDRSLMSIGIVDLQGQLICSSQFPRTPDESPDRTLERIKDAIDQLFQQHVIDRTRIVGIGVGLPGIVNNEEGIVVFSVQLGWKNVPLAKRLKELTGFEIAVDNELKVRALAEHLKGAAVGSSRTALLGFGQGVGSAMILEGEIYRGVMNSAGEIGHTTVDPNGMMCECGKAGCLQTYINISSLLSEANRIRPIRTIEELFAAKHAGEQWAIHLIDRALMYMAITINNVVCMYNPDSVILSGELVDKFPDIYEEVEQLYLSRFTWEPLRGSFTIHRSLLNEKGVIIGSGLLSQNRFFALD